MSSPPAETMAHIRETVRDELSGDARPDFQPRNRWYIVQLRPDRPTARDEQTALAERLRAEGYKVSVVNDDVKVTKAGLHWPETNA